MSNMIINEEVDIYRLPAVDLQHKLTADTEITMGDLHANTMKLMFMLVKHGIARNVKDRSYNKLVEIYRTPTNLLTKRHIQEFNGLLDEIDFRGEGTIRLIGDEMADRGNNDYFTLKVLEKLNQNKIPIEIIASNHGIEFVEAYEKQKNFNPPMLSVGGHARSMENLQELLNKKIVSREEILDIADKAYKPALRALSYSLSEDNSEITIHSHAAVGLNNIKNMAVKLNIEYKDATAAELAQTIDNINSKFQEHVQNNTVHTLYSREIMMAAYMGNNVDLTDAAFEFLLWNRCYAKFDREYLHRPMTHNGYKINFDHGHDSSDPVKENVYNLDNVLGKTDGMNKGTYSVLCSRNFKKAPVNRVNKNIFLDPSDKSDLLVTKNGNGNGNNNNSHQDEGKSKTTISVQSDKTSTNSKSKFGSLFSFLKVNSQNNNNNNNHNNNNHNNGSKSSWSHSASNSIAKKNLPTELLKVHEYSYSIYMMGPPQSGKTSLVNRFVNNTQENHPSANTSSKFEKNKELSLNGDNYKLKFVDYTPGPFDKMLSYREMDAIVLVIDLTSPDAEAIIMNYLEDIKRYGKPEKQYIMLVGNKSDAAISQIDPESILSFAKSNYHINIDYIEVSAKDGINTDVALKQIIKGIDEMKAKVNVSPDRPSYI